jgi:hypothetical protein
MKSNTATLVLVALGALIVGAIIGQQMQKMQAKKDLNKTNGNSESNGNSEANGGQDSDE